MKRNFSGITLKDAMLLLGQGDLLSWDLPAAPRPPSDALQTHLRRLDAFDMQTTEQAKTLLIDALFAETVPQHPNLKVWKAAVLNTDTLTCVADYLIAPRLAYLTTPLLCVVEAKRDDFERGRAQCLAEMVACRDNNHREGHDIEVFGIVSNGHGWRFYKLARTGEVYETDLLAISDLPRLLGALDFICAECARRVPAVPGLP
jgi:hypothetical protein